MEARFLLPIFLFVIAIYWVVRSLRLAQKDQTKKIDEINTSIRTLHQRMNIQDMVLDQIEQCVNDIEDKLRNGERK